MKTRNFLAITGLVLIVLNMLAYMSGNFRLPKGEKINRIAYFLGYNMLSIIGLLLLIIAYGRHKKNIRKKEKEMMDSFLK